MIKIICVGKLKEPYWTAAVQEYKKRLQRYTKIEIIEVEDQHYNDGEKIIKVESEAIKKHLRPTDYCIVLDVQGHELSSIELSQKLETLMMHHSQLVFIIGGSYGLSQDLKEQAAERISFSKLTFPHQLFRIMLLEQLYRSYKIQRNETYHK